MAVPPPPSLTADGKPALRTRLRAARAAFVAGLAAADLARATRAIAEAVVGLLPDEGTIGGYAAHRGEPDVLAILRMGHDRGHRLALPRLDGARAMRFVAWHPDAPLAHGFGGIAEPPGDEEEMPATLLVPLVGFDRAHRRLGQGGGCYDRWLARHRGVRTIGIAWSVQEAEAIPVDPWDVPLDVIVTEAGSIAR